MDSMSVWQPIRSVFDANRFDLMDWSDALEIHGDILANSNRRAYQELWSEATRDAFWSLHKASPTINPSPGLEPLAKLFRIAMNTPNYQKMHDECVGDIARAATASMHFLQDMVSNLPKHIKLELHEISAFTLRHHEIMAEAQGLQEVIDAIDDNEAKADFQKQLEDLLETAETLENQLDAFLKVLDGEIEANETVFTDLFNKAAKKAAQEATEASEFIKGFSTVAGEEEGKLDLDMAKAAMQVFRQNPHIKNLAEVLGWAKRTTRAAYRKGGKTNMELTGFGVKEFRPDHLAPWEYNAMLSDDEEVYMQFLIRLGDGALMHRQFEGDDQIGRGPLVIVRDESGSMSGKYHTLALALEWALLEIARKEKRPFVSIPFSNDCYVWHADPPNLEATVKHLSHFYGGGTEPWGALEAAFLEIDAGDMEADVLMITDEAFDQPDSAFLEALHQARNRRPLKVVVVVIGRGTGQVSWADKVILLDSMLSNKDELAEAIQVVI